MPGVKVKVFEGLGWRHIERGEEPKEFKPVYKAQLSMRVSLYRAQLRASLYATAVTPTLAACWCMLQSPTWNNPQQNLQQSWKMKNS